MKKSYLKSGISYANNFHSTGDLFLGHGVLRKEAK